MVLRSKCPYCGAKGFVREVCRKCEGTGEFNGSRCESCDGYGFVKVKCKSCYAKGWLEFEVPDEFKDILEVYENESLFEVFRRIGD